MSSGGDGNVICSHDLARIVNTLGRAIQRAGRIERCVAATTQQKSVVNTVCGSKSSYDLAGIIDTTSLGKDRVRRVESRKCITEQFTYFESITMQVAAPPDR